MNSNDNNLLSREEAWWFIPEEYCPIFLELEKEFNKQIDIRRQISELESKINDTPTYKREPLKERFKKLNARREHFSRERIVEIVEPLRYDRCIHYSDLADRRLANPKNANGKEDYTFIKFFRYAEIMGDKSITKVIVDRFIKYFKNLGILRETENVEYYFEHYSNHITNYKVPFITAQILLECITRDLEHNSASRVELLKAMHSLIQDPLFAIVEQKDDENEALETVYLERFKDGLQILKNNGIVKKKKGVIGHYEFTYEIDYHLSDNKSPKDASRELNERCRTAAFDKLHLIHARFHQTSSTSKEKEKAKLRSAQSEISEKLSKLDQASKNDRITYHWYNVILQCRNSIEFRKFKTFADDVLSYIRYHNIKAAVTPVVKDSLYKWDRAYSTWSALSIFLQEEAKMHIRSWQISISDSEYQKAVNNILNVINDLIGNDTIEKVPSKNYTDEKSIEQIRVRNEQLLSLFFVRAYIEPLSSNELSSHLEQLFKIIASDESKNNIDLCIIIRQLSLLAVNNTFEYASKTKSWIYALKNIHKGSDSFIVQTTLVSIYNLLIGLSSDDNSIEKYQKACFSLLGELKPQNYDQKDEVILLQFEYLKWSKDSISYQKTARLLSDLWKNIGELFVISDKNDPRPYIYKYDTLSLATGILKSYFDFGYSLAILLSKAYLQLVELKINDRLTNHGLLSHLPNLIIKIKPELAVRIAITNESTGYANWSHNQSIAETLLELGDYNRALTYACKAEESYNSCDLGDIQGQTFNLELHLTKAEILFRLGKEAEANSLCSQCEAKLKELEELYPKEIRSKILHSAAHRLRGIRSSLETLPYGYRWIRLLNILMAIIEMDNVIPEVEAFFNKWYGFNGLDLDEDESNPKELADEFKSDMFPLTMQAISQNVVFKSCDIDTSPIAVDEIKMLNKELQQLYIDKQRTFLNIDVENTDKLISNRQIQMPEFDMLFDLLDPQNNTKAFVNQMNLTNISNSNCNLPIEELEKYHYVVMSEWASNENRLKACQLFFDKIDQSRKSIFIREMAAEILSEKSTLIDFEDWDEKERLLNLSESYIMDKNGTFLSDKAKEIYIRIAHRLCDVYEYLLRDGAASSDYIKYALDIVRQYNIRTEDSAWFIGEYAEHLMYEAQSQGNTNLFSEAKGLFTESIEILQSVNPQTDDSRHYLELYKEFLSLL